MSEERIRKVFEVYDKVQLLERTETTVPKQQTSELSNNWKDEQVPALQKKVVDVQLENLKQGIVDPVFSSLMEALKSVKLSEFTLLDAACASGYYFEVIKCLEQRQIYYSGCDYSEAMVKDARKFYPEIDFQVQDLTRLDYPNQSFDVVLVSGVLEHIPDYQNAIVEMCRVARRYIVIHRCPLISKTDHVFTIGTQYNIYTPRIYFSKNKLIQEFQSQNYTLIKQIETVYHQASWLQSIRSSVKKIIGWNNIRGRQEMAVSTQTLVFRNDQ